MNACVIMHNIIIEDDHGKDEDHTHYELMGVPVQVRRSAHRVVRFIASYHSIRSNDTHGDLQKISWKNGGNGMENNSDYFICIFVVLFQKLCCIVDEQLVVFIVNNWMYLLYYLLVL
jgi:hypothetical protein